MFVAVAAAGMLASCSSESLTGSDPTIEPTQEERVPIQLAVSSPSVRATTRGTGTVGGVGTSDPNNVWAGQRIHVFMVKKGTLDLANDGLVNLYDDAEMITPGTVKNFPSGYTLTDIGEAMLTDGTIQYYPSQGNFDFFAYHGDDAVTPSSYVTTADPWVVPFTITGSQDLMSTKAELLVDGGKGIDQETDMGGSTDYYSAKAARKGVQPILKFDHLLTRLSFVIKAGDKEAAGWDAGLGAQDFNKAVKVTAIQVESKTKGTMAVAWTEDPANMITWDAETDGTPAWLSLMERPVVTLLYSQNSDRTNTTLFITKAAYDALPASGGAGVNDDQADYTALLYSLNSAPTNTAEYLTQAEFDALPDYPTDGDKNDKRDYSEITNANKPLVALTATSPLATSATVFPDTPIGEALIVSPSATDYKMKVSITQKVPTNWNTLDDPLSYVDKSQTYELDIPAPAGGFLANTSYKVVLTVYGFERIQVTTMITPWEEYATPITVGED